jgi:uncharacterized membrane protein YcaP (DUF421 family)
MDYVRITYELLFGFLLLFTITKVLGKTQLNQITPFEFISALVLGELVGNAIFDKEVGLMHIFVALLVWGVLIFIVELFEIKVLRARGILEGNPSIVIHRGRMNRKEMSRNKMSINQLQSLLRQKDVFSLREVEYAIIESNGTVTVMKKPQYEEVTIQDLKLPMQQAALPVNLIIDGRVLANNLKDSGYDMDWLQLQIESNGFSDTKEVFYAEWSENQGIYIEPLRSS